MKEGKYYILVRNLNDQPIVQKVDGYILYDEISGLSFGCRYINKTWEITELSTGLLITSKNGTLRKVDDKDMIESYIDEMRTLVLKVLTEHKELVDRFDSLIGKSHRGKKKMW